MYRCFNCETIRDNREYNCYEQDGEIVCDACYEGDELE